MEKESIDYEIERLAEKESKIFFSPKIAENLNKSKQGDLSTILAETKMMISKSHFVIVELYNARKELVVETVKQEYLTIEDKINSLAHAHLLTVETHHQTHYYNAKMYLQIFTPHPLGSSTPEGFFEGVYEVEEEIREHIKNRLLWSLVLVVVSVLVTTLVLYPVVISLNKSTAKYAKILAQANLGMLEVLGGAIAKRDSDTSLHNFRVTIYSVRLAEQVGISRAEMQALIKGAFLHDVGKIGISDNILLKKGRLTNDEFQIMKHHVQHGADILSQYKWLEDSLDIVQFHHEKYDGSGYLRGLKGADIPVVAKVFAVTDVFDALTSKRPYKEPFSYKEAMDILEKGRGHHFDPIILDLFFQIASELYGSTHSAEQHDLKEILARVTSDFFSIPSKKTVTTTSV